MKGVEKQVKCDVFWRKKLYRVRATRDVKQFYFESAVCPESGTSAEAWELGAQSSLLLVLVLKYNL